MSHSECGTGDRKGRVHPPHSRIFDPLAGQTHSCRCIPAPLSWIPAYRTRRNPHRHVPGGMS
eukprot:7356576-Prymnesium_polylepis.1